MSLCEITLPDPSNILYAAQLLVQGKLVAFPTETVYGLGADAENTQAVASIYQAKGRPQHNPLIVHVADLAMAERYGVFSDAAMQLAQVFWPGPLTLVLRRRPDCAASPLVSAGGETIALRVPGHAVAMALIQALGKGIAAPSANRSGRVSPTLAQHVVTEFAGGEPGPVLVLNGGATEIGIESTVIDGTGKNLRILRAGGVALQALQQVGTMDETVLPEQHKSMLLSPGLLESHYAPRALVRLGITSLRPGEALLAFGPTPFHAPVMRNLSPAGNLEEAAHHLYAYLRELDQPGTATIAVMPVPEEGIGVAINDRLRRAAAIRT